MEQTDFEEQVGVEIAALLRVAPITVEMNGCELAMLALMVTLGREEPDNLPHVVEAGARFIASAYAAIKGSARVALRMEAADAWIVAGLVQCGYRHPGLLDDARAAARRFLNFVKGELCRPGTVLERLFEMGNRVCGVVASEEA